MSTLFVTLKKSYMPFLLILRIEDVKYVTSCYYDIKLRRKIKSALHEYIKTCV